MMTPPVPRHLGSLAIQAVSLEVEESVGEPSAVLQEPAGARKSTIQCGAFPYNHSAQLVGMPGISRRLFLWD